MFNQPHTLSIKIRLSNCLLLQQFTSDLATLNNLWLKTRSEKKRKKIRRSNRATWVFQVLPSFHVTSRCDSISSLCGTGKTVSLTLRGNVNSSMAFVKSEDSTVFGLQDECLEVAIWFACFPYDSVTKNASINDLRRAASQ